MIDLKLNLQHHAEGDSLDEFKGGIDYVVIWEGSWFMCCIHVMPGSHGKRKFLQDDCGIDFWDNDDFWYAELPDALEVIDNA